MCDENDVRRMLLDAVTLLKANGIKAPLTIERIEQYLESEPTQQSVLKPCPECHSPTVSVGSQQLKMCGCGWKDENWTLSKDQQPLYG